MTPSDDLAALALFQPPTRAWFTTTFPSPTRPQSLGWPTLAKGQSTLILAPTGTGKTLTAFMHCIDRLMFSALPAKGRCRVLYLSPLKALASDVEKNLKVPIEGIAAAAFKSGTPFHRPALLIRTGDTPQKERTRFSRDSTDVLITTPESLYLLLTSNAREALRGIETVIVDEIHALVPTKRGSHLALSLERLEHLTGRPFQRIGLSATQRPLDEVARFLGGTGRAVTIVDASVEKTIHLTVEVPIEDMTKHHRSPSTETDGSAFSLWAAIAPRLVELIRSHRSTLLFVNNRRSAERLAQALNTRAHETLVHAHHGSLSKDQRVLVEQRLKEGALRGLVATSSLELGIDMGAIDLVIQIESPPSIASGMQRIGRAGHSVGATSAGFLFPKYRQDLVACAALAQSMREGAVETIRYPRNTLDVLAQQIAAMVSMDAWSVDALYALVRHAAPFEELSFASFEAVLDLLSGRFVSDAFGDLKARITWDRVSNLLSLREGTRRLAVINGGTIPDRGLYGVFLNGAPKGQARVGELDEEMVFESKPGETFVLGASTWRIEAITFDKVMVSAAPGEPGKMPFWRGEQTARPLEFGRRIGALVRSLRDMPRSSAISVLMSTHGLTETAAGTLMGFLEDQATRSRVPDDRTIVVERCRDELGAWRICVLSPFGGQILAPWSMAVEAHLEQTFGTTIETLWANDGFVIRWPDNERPPPAEALIPPAKEVERLVVSRLSATPMFAARFRESASRALLLPRKRPGLRTPLWQIRKRAQDLLAAASTSPSFPIILETYRECLRDVFDMPALVRTLHDIERGVIALETVDTKTPSPFAASMLFGYVANYLYEGDAPLAERRAQALTIDTLQLKELLGDTELRTLLDAESITQLQRSLQCLDERKVAPTVDAVHDVLLRLGDLSTEEISERVAGEEALKLAHTLHATGRAIAISFANEQRLIPIEYAGRYRRAFGVSLPPDVPPAFLETSNDPLKDVFLRFARTHTAFTTAEIAHRFHLELGSAEAQLVRLATEGLLVRGAFLPQGTTLEWCEPEVLQTLRRKSLRRLRKEIEPVAVDAFTRVLFRWQGVSKKQRGLDALLDCIEKLQGLPLPASALERDVLAARIEAYAPADLDALAASGEVVWVGLEAIGETDGRIALYLTDQLPLQHRPTPGNPDLSSKERALLDALTAQGATFFPALHEATGGGFAQETVDALWSLTWRGLVSNDGFFALRHLVRTGDRRIRRAMNDRRASFRSRRAIPPQAEGRWGLVSSRMVRPLVSATEWAHAAAKQLLARYGVVTREVATAESIPGGFSSLHDVFESLETSGRVRRGYFVEGVSAMQFGLPSVLDLLRSARREAVAQHDSDIVTLSSVDPANPYGALLPWPAEVATTVHPARISGSFVTFVDGQLVAWLSRGGKHAVVWVDNHTPHRERLLEVTARQFAARARSALQRSEGAMLETVNGAPANHSLLADALARAGFVRTDRGLLMRRSFTDS